MTQEAVRAEHPQIVSPADAWPCAPHVFERFAGFDGIAPRHGSETQPVVHVIEGAGFADVPEPQPHPCGVGLGDSVDVEPYGSAWAGRTPAGWSGMAPAESVGIGICRSASCAARIESASSLVRLGRTGSLAVGRRKSNADVRSHVSRAFGVAMDVAGLVSAGLRSLRP